MIVVLALLVVVLVVALVVLVRSMRSVQVELAEQRRTAEAVVAEAAAERTQADDTRLRLAQALDAIPQGVLIVDVDGQVVVRNRVADTFADARHSDALVEAAIDELLAAALNGQEGTRPIDLFGPPRRTLVIAATPLPDGALVVVDDISERRRLEATRRDFVANISHELKTPVGAMGLLAETLLAEDDRQVASRLAERIVNEAFRLDRTIEDLLVLSRIEGEEIAAHEPVAARLLVADAVERIRPAAEQAGIDVAVEEIEVGSGVDGEPGADYRPARWPSPKPPTNHRPGRRSSSPPCRRETSVRSPLSSRSSGPRCSGSPVCTCRRGRWRRRSSRRPG